MAETKRDHTYGNKRPFENSQQSSDSASDSDLLEESSDESKPLCWITWHCTERSNRYLCEVEKEYIEDSFNLYGLGHLPHYRRALDRILDIEEDSEDEEESPQRKTGANGDRNNGTNNSDEDSGSQSWRIENEVEDTAEKLYGLIHERYIKTAQGMNAMLQKYVDNEFGRCPRIACGDQTVLPLGLSDTPGKEKVKVYCPKCREIYQPHGPPHLLDGAYIGTTFPYLFLMQYPVAIGKRLPSKPPTVYGFRVHKSSPFWRGNPPLEDQENNDGNANKKSQMVH